ncbi:MAG: sulfatase [Thermoleophilaceae bacterium]|nr:sulfatase [Thermoleophilaceae bacterium]
MLRRIRPGWAAATTLGGACAALALWWLGGTSETAPAAEPGAPNVLVVMTDDQDSASMRVMRQTRQLIGARGTTFANSFATTPLCCPSRATFFTGQYAHNHGVRANKPGYAALDTSETVPVWLDRDGYRTAHVGKFLNRYGRDTDPREVPPGWDEWYASVDPSTYSMYGYTLNENGQLVNYGSAPRDYQTDVYADKAVDFVERSAGDQPFFLSVGTLAPHKDSGNPPRPAPRHAGAFANAPLPRPPSFNEKHVRDKPAFIRNRPRLGSARVDALTKLHRGRLRSLLAVDDLVKRVIDALRATGELANTLVIFTSDNGFLLGQHRLTGKNWVYESSVRVPLLIRGPGVPPGATRRQLVGNVDLAATILDATGATAPASHPLDGVSLLPLALNPNARRGRQLLLESYVVPYTALRTSRYLFVRHRSGERELYDMRADPDQQRSLHAQRSYNRVESDLAARLRQLEDCAGRGCAAGSR